MVPKRMKWRLIGEMAPERCKWQEWRFNGANGGLTVKMALIDENECRSRDAFMRPWLPKPILEALCTGTVTPRAAARTLVRARPHRWEYR